MVKHSLLAAFVFLGACHRQDSAISACETFTKATLSSPESYELVSSSVVDRPAQASDFVKPVTTEIEKLALQNEAKKGLGLRVVGLDYKAENGLGMTVGDHIECAFKTVSGKVSDNLDDDVEAAISDFRFRLVMQARGTEFIPKKYPCCE